MKFIVPINLPEKREDGSEGSITAHVIDTGSDNARFNKRILKSYFKQKGVPTCDLKKVMKLMGFWGKELGR